jgi:hypothetical protein
VHGANIHSREQAILRFADDSVAREESFELADIRRSFNRAPDAGALHAIDRSRTSPGFVAGLDWAHAMARRDAAGDFIDKLLGGIPR